MGVGFDYCERMTQRAGITHDISSVRHLCVLVPVDNLGKCIRSTHDHALNPEIFRDSHKNTAT